MYKGLDQSVKNYLVSVPLVADLRSPAMRPRHWEALMQATGVSGHHVDALCSLQHRSACCTHHAAAGTHHPAPKAAGPCAVHRR